MHFNFLFSQPVTLIKDIENQTVLKDDDAVFEIDIQGLSWKGCSVSSASDSQAGSNAWCLLGPQ